MRESLETFVRCPANEEAARVFDDLNGGIPTATRAVVAGPRHSGKTTLARALGADAQRNGAEQLVFVCSGADIALALMDEDNDAFFERLGATAVLVIDDVAPLARAEKGDQLLALLIEERDRLGLSTALMADGALEDYELPLSAPLLADFRTVTAGALDEEGRQAFVRQAQAEYRAEASPDLTEDAVAFIANELPGGLPDREMAVRYLMTDPDCAVLGTIDGAAARRLLQQ